VIKLISFGTNLYAFASLVLAAILLCLIAIVLWIPGMGKLRNRVHYVIMDWLYPKEPDFYKDDDIC